MAEVELLPAAHFEEVRPLLLDLLLEEQGHYSHRQMSRAEIDGGLVGEIRPAFDGENVILITRAEGETVGFCLCVIFDPGTGLEGEVAEVYIRPEHRGQGLARQLLRRAVELFQERRVTLGQVWTHPNNPAAIRLYRSAGFAPTEQLVMTWLPEDE